MTEKQKKEATATIEEPKKVFVKRAVASIFGPPGSSLAKNPWSDANMLAGKKYEQRHYLADVKMVRFFYRTEPIVSTVVNKLVEIGVNELVFSKNGLSDNEFRIFNAIKPQLLNFAEVMAQEFLLSGLVVPEFTFKSVDKDYLTSYGIKKKTTMQIPDSMWVRDPKTIIIKSSVLTDQPIYFLKIPKEFIEFIINKGKYSDGTEDTELYNALKKEYPEMVAAVLDGKTEIKLENDNVIRRKYLSDNPYPIPYVAPSLEALQHKRKLRRMDYSIVDKVISAIMHIKIGSDDFPVTDAPEDQEYVDDIKSQLEMRSNSQLELERIFQLITNHVVDINWVFPDTSTLLDEKKYEDINQEILFGLGFPRILITGESQRTGTSDPEMALIAPIRTMENFRKKLIEIVRIVCKRVSELNGFNSTPTVYFKEINMHKFSDFINGLVKLYEVSALSRTDLTEVYGYDFYDQLDKITAERDELKKRGLPEVGLTPFSSPQLQNPNGQQNNTNPNDNNKDNNTDDKTNKNQQN